jgi:hypothetical protein
MMHTVSVSDAMQRGWAVQLPSTARSEVASVTATRTLELQPGWTAELQTDQAVELTFIQIAHRVTHRRRVLHLADLSPVTLSVSAPPASRIGHLTTGAFLDLWQSGTYRAPDGWRRFGVVALLDPENWPFGDALVRVSEPCIHGSGLQYRVDLLEGALPESSGAAVLLIHPPGVEMDALRTPP